MDNAKLNLLNLVRELRAQVTMAEIFGFSLWMKQWG